MAAPTYIPDASRLVEVSFQKETTYGTYVYNDMTQLAHNGVTWGRGHQQIEGQATAGTTQHVITYRAIRGIDNPFVSRADAIIGCSCVNITLDNIAKAET